MHIKYTSLERVYLRKSVKCTNIQRGLGKVIIKLYDRGGPLGVVMFFYVCHVLLPQSSDLSDLRQTSTLCTVRFFSEFQLSKTLLYGFFFLYPYNTDQKI